jgi:uncharacterized protein (TIGR02271 family)
MQNFFATLVSNAAEAVCLRQRRNAMPDIGTVRTWRGKTMVDRDGSRIGPITDIYADTQTGQPEWALVDTGLFGAKSTFVPIVEARTTGDDVQVPYQKQLIKDAPTIEADRDLSVADERELWRHYGLDYDASGDTAGRDVPGQPTDTAMTRSEEELQVGTTRRERGRVRLRKYVTTEEVTKTVPVQREEVRLEREPITDENLDAATSGSQLSEAEHEVVLHEEEPVVEKRVVPKERVRLDADAVTDEREVAEEVRKEQIDIDDQEAR